MNLSNHIIFLPSGETISVTASFGVTSLQKDVSIEDSIQSADHALLCAKAQGRNQVCLWEDSLSEFK